MVQFNLKRREITLKVVYYGPPLSGKTTNLRSIFAAADRRHRGRLVTLETRDDRTIYFDMLPVLLQTGSGHRLSVKLYTVPGQPVHDATRRLVLRGVDAVVFVASNERSELESNSASWRNFRDNLSANKLEIEQIPVVIQFNKQDLPNGFTGEEIRAVERFSGIATYGAVALTGDGCYETLRGLLFQLWDQLCRRQSLDERLGLSRAEFERHIERVFAPGRSDGGIRA
jgi:signal recognition particle receptor subunit beta